MNSQLRLRLLTLGCVATVAVCASEPETPAEEVASATAASELLAADEAFAALSDSTDARTAFAAYLDPEPMMLTRTGGPYEGFDAVLHALGDASTYSLRWQPQFAEVAASDDFGWTWGYYQLLVDGTEVRRGKYVNVWRRQPDGAWKVRLDMGNVEPAQP